MIKSVARYLRAGKSLARISFQLGKYKWADFKRGFWRQYFPTKPVVINMMANDICNSKCGMCNIWKQKQGFELTPEQLGGILNNRLFSEVQYVGITGGEPTLRTDLGSYYESVCKSLPRLKGIGGITNAIKADDVIKRYLDVFRVAQQYNVKFGLMVSLDGYQADHDKHRGREGNFDSALTVINYFREHTDISVSIGCTITKSNVWDVDELLDFLIQEKIYGRFRVGEYINRLYNEDLSSEIRSFNYEESYHLSCFFQRLLTLPEFERNEKVRRTYKSIIGVLNGESRSISCPYQDRGVVLDSRGNIQYCAPKSKNLGSVLNRSAYELYKNNLGERRRILNEDCGDCIHDYHAPITFNEKLEQYLTLFWKKALSPQFSHLCSKLALFPILVKKDEKKLVFITGWYGTETVGDKAILGAIINHYTRLFNQNVTFILSAITPFVTERTLYELNISAKVVPCYSYNFVKAALSADVTVMGGGPLMGMGALSIPLSAFRIAKKAKKRTVVFGCGIGPLISANHISMVREIIQLANEVRLRDSASVRWGKKLTDRNDIVLSGDPAYHYLKEAYSSFKVQKKKYLACFLRDWTLEYQGNLSEQEFYEIKEKFEKKLAESIIEFCCEFDLEPRFYSMHTFPVGGDDRTFYRRFTKKYFSDIPHYIEEKPSSVHQIVKAMQESSVNVCMRFHSVLFSHTLGTNFIAIDYTQGGKIRGFLEDNQAINRMYDLVEIAQMKEFSLIKALAG